jgi:phosphatidylglycerol:prolipoprotein diacylglycerol transferase
VLQVPFLHTAWLLSAAAGTLVVSSFLPRRRWRLAVAVVIGSSFAAILAAMGVVPWLGTLHLAAYGLFMLLAFIVAYLLVIGRARVIGIDEREVVDAFLIALCTGLVGARARYVWERSSEFLLDAHGHHRPLTVVVAQMVDFDGGGMVWYGGFTLAMLSVLFFAWKKRIRILAFSDIVAPALLAGLAMGRIGCSVNGCCYGRPTSGGSTFLPVVMHHAGVVVYPTQLYESIACAVMAGFLWWGWKYRKADGLITVMAVIGYAAWRFFNETLRGDDKIPSNLLSVPSEPPSRLFGLPVDTSMATSVQMVVAAVAIASLVIWYRRRHPAAAFAAHQVPGSRYGAATLPAAPPQPT